MTDPTVQSLAVGPRFDAPLPALQTPPPGLRIPVTQTDLASMRLKGTPMGEIVSDLARFVCDPYGFVMWAFPWGQPNTMLADMKGPEQWQKEQLIRIGKQLVEAGPEGCVIQEDVASGHGVGKAQPLSLVVDTPAGRRQWGDVRIGDMLFGRHGPTRVIARHDHGEMPVFRVTFDDGSSTLCCGDHRWAVRGRQQRRKGAGDFTTLSTKQLIERGVKRANGRAAAAQWELPTVAAVEYPQRVLPVHPYTLGVWLGDGGRLSGRVTSDDPCMIERLRTFGEKVSVGSKQGTTAKTLGIFGLKVKLRGLGILDRYAHEKSVPEQYKQAPTWVRASVLRGLMDTDGEATSTGVSVFSTTSRALADDVIWLARSLGGKAMMQGTVKMPFYRDKHGNKVRGLPCYRVTLRMPLGFRTFYIERKQARVKDCEQRYRARWITSIEQEGTQPVMCVTVDAPDHLYLTNDFIPTHNSALVSWLILWAVSTLEDTRGVVTANTDSQLRTKTWAELAKWHSLFLAKDLFKLTATRIGIANDDKREIYWRVDQVPWSKENTEAFAGLHNQGKRILVIFDEASAIDDKIWEVAEGALTDANTQIIWCRYGNPTRTSGAFFRNCTQGKRNTYTRVDSRTVSFSNKKQIQAWVDEYGEDSDFVRVRVRGMFPRAGYANFISPELVNAARVRKLDPITYRSHQKILSVDPARFGDDFSVMTLRQGLRVYWQMVLSGFDGPDLAARIFEVVRNQGRVEGVPVEPGNIACITYDAIGNGADLDSALRRMVGLPPCIAVQWGQPAKDDKQYFNQRSECWGKMRDFLEHGAIPDDDDLANELSSLDYGYDARFRIQLQSKKDLKKAGGKSPDRADSLALSFVPELIDRKIVLAKVRPVERRKVVWTR